MDKDPPASATSKSPYQASSSDQPPTDSVSGVLERITFHNEETGYTVARLAVEHARDLVTVVGSMNNPAVGEMLVCEGRWSAHREYGRQFLLQRYATTRPASLFAIEKYLGSGLIKGVGPVMARRMVEHFQLETLDVIDQDPKKLLRVEGIGSRRVEMIQRAWHEQREIRNVMLFLQDKGVSATYAVKIYKKYGDQSIQVVESNPYRLAEDIWGIGFKTADKIARQLGVPEDSVQRLEAGILHTLSEATDFGHMYLPEPVLLRQASEILGVEAELLGPIIEAMAKADKVRRELVDATDVVPEITAIYHPALYFTEVGLANQLKRRLNSLAQLAGLFSAEEAANWMQQDASSSGSALSEEQSAAVVAALTSPIFVLTGGPGTGKTFTTNTIVRGFEAHRKRIVLASPTGRAAKRLSEVTGRDAVTIHRLLKYDPNTREFQYNEENRLPCDVLIADEVSMLDSVLALNLLKAVPDSAQIVFVGDSDQLPSVGAGNVLKDMLSSGALPFAALTRVFRQAEQSLIVRNAHKIRVGEIPYLITPDQRGGSNCIFVEAMEPEDGSATSAEVTARLAVKLARKTLPALGFSLDDIQVLSPSHRGSAGVGLLNELLQDALNPANPRSNSPELVRGSRRFRAGDRVIQLVNDYDKNVFNGDVGIIREIKPVEQEIHVRFPDNEVVYDFADYDQLQLAYAMSIHKSQGSEYGAVVLIVHSSHYMMLQRNLLYTGLTRAREMCLIVGDRKAIYRAVKNERSGKRYTRLADRICAAI
jgi:exodeoxyribonuclease V alpha subunit